MGWELVDWMKTATPAAAGEKSKTMTFLQHVGNFFKTLFVDAEKVAVAVQPVVDLAFPGIAPLYNATVQSIAMAETAAAAASGSAHGTGPAKLAAVAAAIEPIALAYLKQNGMIASTEQITAWVNAVVATLNALPAPTAKA